MTAREKLGLEHPDHATTACFGGCWHCPSYYGYLEDPEWCGTVGIKETRNDVCRRCWDREIPEEVPCGDPTGGLIVGDEKIEHPDTDISEEEFDMVKELPKDLVINPHELFAEPHILDSGDRTEFASGAVRDMRVGKGRCDLLPLDVIGDFMDDEILYSINHFMTDGIDDHLLLALNSFIQGMWDTYTMLLEVAKHFEEGGKKYGDNNWQKGIPVNVYIDSALRHYFKFLRGDKDEPHDRAFCWNILCAVWTCRHKPELNPYKESGDE